jgi:hypothetical protein
LLHSGAPFDGVNVATAEERYDGGVRGTRGASHGASQFTFRRDPFMGLV